jgi:hypothetical protein
MRPSIDAFIAEVEHLSAATVEIDDARGSAEVGVGSQHVARIDLRDGHVLVKAPADTIPALQRLFPAARPTAEGIAFHVDDPRDRAQALAAIRRRVGVQWLVPQYRAGSP